MKKILKVTPDFVNKERIILRDFLSLERTKLANERTLLSYIRASLYLLLGGIAFLQLKGFYSIKWIGYLALFLSAAFIVIGIYRYLHLNKRLEDYYREYKAQEAKEVQKEESAD